MNSTSDFVDAVQSLSTEIRDARRKVAPYEDPVSWGPAASLESQDALIQQNVHLGIPGVKTAAVRRRLAYMTEEELYKEAAIMGAALRGVGAAAKGVGKALGWGAKTTAQAGKGALKGVHNIGKKSRAAAKTRRTANAAKTRATRQSREGVGRLMNAAGVTFDAVDAPLTAGSIAAPGFALSAGAYNRMGVGGGYG